ncbi:MAG: methyltransferase [Kofleriaceae bacterium]
MIQDLLGLSEALHAAIEAQLLPALLGRPRTAIDYARTLSLDPRATERVLDVLVAFDVATRTGDDYAASPELANWAATTPAGAELGLALWSHVPTFLRTGKPYIRMDGAREASYANVVTSLGRMFGPAATSLAAQLTRAPRNILDIGCGSGVWSLAIAERFPDARVTGLDLPAVLEAFHSRARMVGVADRTSTIAGDVHAVDIPRAFDLVVIANVLRIEAPDRARAIVRRAARALEPGGELLVVDALSGGTPARERAREIYALHLAMRTDHGRVYSSAEITGWMTAEGLRDVAALSCDADLSPVGALLARSAS